MTFKSFSTSGTGIHLGRPCTVHIHPAEPGQGIVFSTPDGDIPAVVQNIDSQSQRSTDLRKGCASIKTVEHLMAAASQFVCDATISVDGPEIPILDGSSLEWVNFFKKSTATTPFTFFEIPKVIKVQRDASMAIATPVPKGETPKYTVELDYCEKSIGPLFFEWNPHKDDFASSLAPARTFALESEVQALRKAGLGKGGTLQCALILGKYGVLNDDGKRFTDEPARHKMLDVLGDMALIGKFPLADLHFKKPGHKLTHNLLRELRESLHGHL